MPQIIRNNQYFFSNVIQICHLGYFPNCIFPPNKIPLPKYMYLMLRSWLHSCHSCTLVCWHPYQPCSFLRKFHDSFFYSSILQQYIGVWQGRSQNISMVSCPNLLTSLENLAVLASAPRSQALRSFSLSFLGGS